MYAYMYICIREYIPYGVATDSRIDKINNTINNSNVSMRECHVSTRECVCVCMIMCDCVGRASLLYASHSMRESWVMTRTSSHD